MGLGMSSQLCTIAGAGEAQTHDPDLPLQQQVANWVPSALDSEALLRLGAPSSLSAWPYVQLKVQWEPAILEYI